MKYTLKKKLDAPGIQDMSGPLHEAQGVLRWNFSKKRLNEVPFNTVLTELGNHDGYVDTGD